MDGCLIVSVCVCTHRLGGAAVPLAGLRLRFFELSEEEPMPPFRRELGVTALESFKYRYTVQYA